MIINILTIKYICVWKYTLQY